MMGTPDPDHIPLDANTGVRLTYVWDWWKFHAKQRTDMFNYFLIITGILANAYATSLKEHYIELAVGVAAVGAIAAIGFLLLDIRNRFQLRKADEILKAIEPDLLTGKRALAGIDPADASQMGERAWVKHKFVFRMIETIIFMCWALLFFWNILDPGRFAGSSSPV
jgi:hypothetical protein